MKNQPARKELTLSTLQALKKVWANCVDPDEMTHMSHLIWIFPVCLLVLLFSPISNFAFFFSGFAQHPFLTQWTLLQFKAYLRNLGVKVLRKQYLDEFKHE